MNGMDSRPNRRYLTFIITLQLILSIVHISSAKLVQPEFMSKTKREREAQENSNETWITLTSGTPASFTPPPDIAPAISPVLAPILNSLLTDPPTIIDDTNEPIVELTGEPTDIEVIDTSTPTIGPTKSPTMQLTSSPTAAPTLSPTRRPTSSPTDTPTDISTGVPTEAPTDRPTKNPTKSPTVSPTISPTAPPEDPTETPTISPTDSPTQNPTLTPTSSRTLSPASSATTTSPTDIAAQKESAQITQTLPGLSIVLQPLAPLNETGISAFEKGTDTYYDYYYNRINSESFSDVQKQVRDVTVQTKVISQNPPYSNNNGRRRLQMQQILYEQRVSYRLNNDANNTITSKEIVLDAMNSKAKRDVYLITLQVQSPEVFDPVDTVYMVEFQQPNQGDPGQTTAPPPVGGASVSSTTIAIITVVSALLVLFIILGGVWFYRKRRNNNGANNANGNKNEYSNRASGGAGGYRSNDDDLSQDFDDGNELEAAAIGVGGMMQNRQNTNIRVPSNNYADEVSTLAEPVPRLGVISSGDMSYAGYEDKSIATVDYDYSKAYGGGSTSFTGSSSFSQQQQVSSFNSQYKQRNASPPQQQQNQLPQSSFSVFSDDASFDAHYQEPYKEQTIEVLAPAGKLGVVIDTPDEGAPIVHAIKETSCVADKLKVGDKLIRVDEEDVTAMTAIKVSKLISRKSANSARKLTIVRTVVNDD